MEKAIFTIFSVMKLSEPVQINVLISNILRGCILPSTKKGKSNFYNIFCDEVI